MSKKTKFVLSAHDTTRIILLADQRVARSTSTGKGMELQNMAPLIAEAVRDYLTLCVHAAEGMGLHLGEHGRGRLLWDAEQNGLQIEVTLPPPQED